MIITLITWVISFIFGALIMAAALWALRVLWDFLSGAIDWVSEGEDPFA